MVESKINYSLLRWFPFDDKEMVVISESFVVDGLAFEHGITMWRE